MKNLLLYAIPKVGQPKALTSMILYGMPNHQKKYHGICTVIQGLEAELKQC